MQQQHKLHIHTYHDVIRNEKEILHRIEKRQNGGRLFLMDPCRLLMEIGVELSEHALIKWDEATGGFFKLHDHAGSYDALSTVAPDSSRQCIIIRNLIRKEVAS